MSFVKGRAISDNILLAQEFFHDLDVKVRGGNSILKLDISKSYDNISWQLIYNIMHLFGFSLTFINLIKSCIECPFSFLLLMVRALVFLNLLMVLGKVTLCPLALFIIVIDYLSRSTAHLFASQPQFYFRRFSYFGSLFC
ncbi:5'-3' exoribonuclease 2 [Dendrobium catenatum]|uniref:5'-3' exoribonuclease 2 n=1 Tax=Dendrobium catenatum TaxID=906689 RepID=A0A2I0VND6_9ASPA|nr:5'-3' exoribonuclease 2 [Dendrobium catenatum]